MCGIVGIMRLRDSEIPSERVLRRMVTAIRNRGPDGEGYHCAESIGLGHARLSIIDLSGGQQPIRNEDGSIWVSYNGEIFNYVELRKDLQRRGHVFYTQTDTEVIVHLYEEYGDRFVDHLNGQFAFALWDARKRRLLLVRDRAGILPLYYYMDGDSCVFGSEVKAILASGQLVPKIDPVGLDQVFTFWSPLAPRTMFEGVSQVCPGEMVVIEEGKLCRHEYWNWSFPARGDLRHGSDDTLSRELCDLLEDATRIRLRADVPVGAYLSGGLDSSTLVSLIKNGGAESLKTFSIRFEQARLDESKYQTEVADWLQTEHRYVRCTNDDIERGFIDTVRFAEMPILRTSPTPMRLLSDLVRREGFKVVMTGEGADEVLGGYDIFKEAKIRRFWAQNPNSSWRPSLLKRLYPYLELGNKQGDEYVKAFFGKGLDDPDNVWFSHLPRWQLTSRIKMFYSEKMRNSIGPETFNDLSEQLPEDFSAWHPFNRAEFLEAKTLLPGYILASQGDRMMMANSVEGRFPFLDHRLISFANGLHPKYKMRALNEKFLLKRAMQARLPPSVIGRFKQPYRGPGAGSLSGCGMRDFVEMLLSEEKIAQAGCFNSQSVNRLKKKVEQRGAELGERDNMAYIGILATQAWHYHFVESPSPDASS